MSATHYPLGQGASAELEGSAQDDVAGARRRLTLAVLWLAGLIGWGLLSYVSGLPADDGGRVLAPAAQQFDGHGKWVGY
jgi:hypothetical protein